MGASHNLIWHPNMLGYFYVDIELYAVKIFAVDEL